MNPEHEGRLSAWVIHISIFPFSLFFLDFSFRDHLRSHLLSLDYLSFVHLDFSLAICVFLAFGLFLRSRFVWISGYIL